MKPSDIKRMALIDGDSTAIRKKSERLIQEGKLNKDDQIQIGNALESLVTSAGWTVIESYIFRHGRRALSEKMDADSMAEVRGMMSIITYVNNMIMLKNDLLRSANEKE